MKKLKIILIQKGMTQRELAEKISGNNQRQRIYHIYSLCQGKKTVNINLLKEICSILKCSATDILGY